MPREVAEILPPEERRRLADALRVLKTYDGHLDQSPIVCLSPVGHFERVPPLEDDHICEGTLLEKMDPDLWMAHVQRKRVKKVENLFHSARDAWQLETIDPDIIPKQIAR